MDDVRVRIRLIDDASRGFARLEQQTREVQRRIAQCAQQSAQAQEQAQNNANTQIGRGFSQLEQQTRAIQQRMVEGARRAAQEETEAAVRSTRAIRDAHVQAFQGINAARTQLSVRSHAAIAQDISQTRAAYQTLARSGVSSFREQAQAADAMRRHITELTNEMGRLTTAQRAYQGLSRTAMVGGAVIGGVAGTAYAMKQPIVTELDFDKRIAYLTNTAFPKRDLAGKLAGANELREAIHRAMDIGKINRSGATNMLDVMISGGIMNPAQSMQSLPFLAKTAVANDADPQDVARLTNVLYGTNRVKDLVELKKAHNMAIAAGQAGGFEYKNQVMYLPEQLGVAKAAGMTGLKGLRDVLTLNETSMLSTGTADQAGVSTFNLLSKLASKDTAKDFDKAGRGDLYKALIQARSKGMSALEFWQKIIEQEIAMNPAAAKYKAKLAKSKSPAEQKEIMDALEQIMSGSSIVTYFQEIRAKNAMLGYQNVGYRKKVEAEADAAMSGRFTPNESNFELIKQTNAIKVDVLKNTYEKQQEALLRKTTPMIGSSADFGVEFAKNHPTIAKYAPIVPWAAGGAAGAATTVWALKSMMPSVTAGVASSSLAANLSVASARLATLLSSSYSSAGTYLSRAPMLARAGMSAAAPYAPLAARAAAIPAAAYTGYQVGGLINQGLNAVVSKLTGHESTLGTAIHEFVSGESTFNSAVHNLMSWKPDPVRVDTHVTVALAPGLVPIAQSSKGTNTGGGANTATVGGKGNIWTGAPQ